MRSNVRQNLANKAMLEIIEWQFIIGSIGTRNCIVNANRSSTLGATALTDVLFLFLSVFHQASPRAFPGYSLLWWAVKSCTSTPCKINRSSDRSVVRHLYSAFAGPDQRARLLPSGPSCKSLITELSSYDTLILSGRIFLGYMEKWAYYRLSEWLK